MEQNKVEILEALNNEKMYSLRGDEVGEMCSSEGNDTRRNCREIMPEKSRRPENSFLIKNAECVQSFPYGSIWKGTNVLQGG